MDTFDQSRARAEAAAEARKQPKKAYVVIQGLFTSNKTPVEYIETIVYGSPRIEAVLVGSRVVAILEYAEGQDTAAHYTFERMSSFNLVGAYTYDTEVALREFGGWIRHYAPGTIAGLHERREAALTEALGVAPGETKRIEIDKELT